MTKNLLTFVQLRLLFYLYAISLFIVFQVVRNLYNFPFLLVFIPGYLFWLLYLFILFLLLISNNRLMSRFYGETDCCEF